MSREDRPRWVGETDDQMVSKREGETSGQERARRVGKRGQDEWAREGETSGRGKARRVGEERRDEWAR